MPNRVTICAVIIGLICPFTQVARAQQPDPVQPPPATMVEGPQRSTGGVSASEVATANNPIAPMNAIFFQNYYAPTNYGVPGSGNLLDLRGVVISGRQIIRSTLPISSGEDSSGNQQSGLGDFNVFDAIRLTPEKSRNVLAIGLLLTAPTATNPHLGQGKWQAGFAAVGLHSLSAGSEVIGILTWQHSFAGEHTRPDAQSLTFQPIAALSIGGGYYVRSSGIWSFDIANDKRVIPLGIGFGKVFKIGNAIVNASIEPQLTVYHDGFGLPSFQLFSGLQFLFKKETE
jgi:hypothetical protein